MAGELHQRTIQHQPDPSDAGKPVDCFAPHLDVKNGVACFAVHGCNMVAGGVKLIEMSVKGLPVVISPSCAHLVDERPMTCNRDQHHVRTLCPVKSRANVSDFCSQNNIVVVFKLTLYRP